MALTRYLAMTAAEIAKNPNLPPNIGWMACHFSPYGTALSNFPRHLPDGSLLILNDRTPIHGHDPEQIAAQLSEHTGELHCSALLLDFQRPDCEETAVLVDYLLQAASCPVVVSDVYAKALNCPVFLPPVPPSVSLEAHLDRWKGRDIWLEIGLDGEMITLTEAGASVTSLPHFVPLSDGHWDKKLHCHYKTEVGEIARFTLWRTQEDWNTLAEEAVQWGVTAMVGLYQELADT